MSTPAPPLPDLAQVSIAQAIAVRSESPCFPCVLEARRRTLAGERVWAVTVPDKPPEVVGSEIDRPALGDYVGPPLDKAVEDWPVYWRRLVRASSVDPDDVYAQRTRHVCEDRDLARMIDLEAAARRRDA